MKLYVPSNYLDFTAVKSMREITHSVFNHSPIDYFDFTRVFYDSKWMWLTPNPDLYLYTINAGFVFLPNINLKKPRSFHYLEDIPYFKPSMIGIKNNFNITNVISYVKKQDNYIDIYWFATHTNRAGALNYFLNNLDKLEHYSNSFRDSANNLIKKGEKNLIDITATLKDQYSPTIQKIMSLGNTINNPIYNNKKSILLSKRELECCTLLIGGDSSKIIANKLKLSFRTVEFYLDNVKKKLQCRNRYELISLLIKHIF